MKNLWIRKCPKGSKTGSTRYPRHQLWDTAIHQNSEDHITRWISTLGLLVLKQNALYFQSYPKCSEVWIPTSCSGTPVLSILDSWLSSNLSTPQNMDLLTPAAAPWLSIQLDLLPMITFSAQHLIYGLNELCFGDFKGGENQYTSFQLRSDFPQHIFKIG